MRKKIRAAHAAAWLLGGATLVISGRASADNPACNTFTNPVYVSGSSAIKPVLQAVQNVLGSAVSIVYQNPGSCEGLAYVIKGTTDADSPNVFVPNTTTLAPCNPPTTGVVVDIAFSDVYPATCTAYYDSTLPAPSATQKDFLGPIQAMTFAVPKDSSENIISAEAAFTVFGKGAADGPTAATTIAPWTDPSKIYVRYYDSGTLEMMAKAINLPGSKWAQATVNMNNMGGPTTFTGTGPMQNALIAAEGAMATQSTAIGILSTSGLKTGIKGLAFQGYGQLCSYYPDSGMSAGDKINVRQGRYEIWGPEHMVANVDGNGKPVGQNSNTAAVQTVINALISTSQALPASSDAGVPEGGVTTLGEAEVKSIIAAISGPTTGFIPQCAMQVSRTQEIGAEASYAPPVACSCAFEAAAGMSPGHTCTACNANADCNGTPATPVCHFNFCAAE
jgi:hypothetical protein